MSSQHVILSSEAPLTGGQRLEHGQIGERSGGCGLAFFFFSNWNQRSFEWYCVIRVSPFCSLYGARLCTLRNTVFLNFLDLRPIKHTRETSVGLFTQGKSTRKSMAYGFLKCEAVSFSYDPDSLQTMPEKTEN